MEMNELRYFLAVSQTENVQRASENINVSAGSLSKAIARLESELGVKLFNRVGRGITLTEEGHFLTKKASAILNLETEVKLSILGQEASFKAILGANETLLSHFGVELAQKIKDLYPNSSIELVGLNHSSLLTKLADGEVNLGLSTQEPRDDFDYKKIAEVKFHTVVSKGHPLYKKVKRNIEISIEEILEYDFVVSKNNILGKTSANQSADGWRDDKFRRKIPYITQSLKTLESLVKSGKALAYLPDYMIVNSDYEIVNILGCPYQCKQKVYLISRNKKELSWINQIF
ncbi:LysR family transcriptional regulator [Halobacteriovorax sp. HLS]|uniref:LysR family transcriptional regulator n=1 Tax=Halobacteriovorax sp. HLS TaxID=2234000 RepID=UPI000FD8FFDC|nr:LysR family transcriptional regulator [Halobacteriovorax sp. HLS]